MKRDRRVQANLRRHKELSDRFVAEGMDPNAASKRAFNVVTGREQANDFIRGRK